MNEIQINAKGLKVTEFGIEEVGSVTPQEIQSALKSVMKFDTMLQFYIGDLINIASYRWGEKYDKWEEVTGCSYDTLSRCSRVAARFPVSFREEVFAINDESSNVVSWTHFFNTLPLSDEKALYFLQMVRDGGWSVAKLIDEIKLSKNGGKFPEPKVYELPEGFAPIKEAGISSYVPAPEPIGETKKMVRRLVEITEDEARILLKVIAEEHDEDARLFSFCERLVTAFGG